MCACFPAQLFAIPWTISLQARILECVDISIPGDLPDPGTEPESPALAGGFFATVTPPHFRSINYLAQFSL